MKKVVIVDDELAIRKGLRTLIDWERYGFEVAGDAANGREGLRLHAELAPDLMVVDIKMPGMDGLQLLGEIRKTDPVCRFLVLSGYADFQYAKQAIGCGVNGYMLKPVDEEEMHRELERIAAEMEDKAQTARLSRSKRREELLRAVLHGGAAAEGVGPEELEELTGGQGRICGILLLAVSSSASAGAGGAPTAAEAYGTAKSWLTEAFDTCGCGFVFPAEPYIGLLLYENPGMPKVRQRLYDELSEGLGALGLTFTAAAGPAAGSPEGLAASYAGACRLLGQRFLLGGAEIHTRLGAEVEELLAAEAEPAEKAAAAAEKSAEKLYFALDLGDKEGVRDALAEAGRWMLRQDPAEQAVKTQFAQLITVVLGKLSADGTAGMPRVQEGMPVVTGIYEQPSYQDLLRYVGSAFDKLIDAAGSTSSEPVLKQMLHFIQRHYSENLKLETLAELFKYNSGYLGKLFKNYTGDSFHTYLDKVRIRRAIELLGEGLKVHQVAQLVGYANVDYFHSKFKKYVGMPPSAYKEKPQRAEVKVGGNV